MKIERLFDVAVILEVLTNDIILDAISEDGFDVKDLPKSIDVVHDIWLELVSDSNDSWITIGVVQFKPMFSNCYAAHIHILPEFRKEFSMQAGDKILEYCSTSEDLKGSLLYTNVPVFCENVKNFLLSFGFTEQGILPNAWKKNGKQNDMWILIKEIN